MESLGLQSSSTPWRTPCFLASCEQFSLQDFQGLSTTPTQQVMYPIYNDYATYLDMNMNTQASRYRVEEEHCSTRSQFRGHHMPQQYKPLKGGAGVRVELRSQRSSEGASAPKPWVRSSLGRIDGCNRSRKRSYLRAVRRLQRTGQTEYRGKKFYQSSSVGCGRTKPALVSDGRRTQFFTWNCGGLSPEIFTEALQWADDIGPNSSFYKRHTGNIRLNGALQDGR